MTEDVEQGRVEPRQEAAPWESELDGVVFANVWATGSDPAADTLLRLRTQAVGADAPEPFDGWCQPPAAATEPALEALCDFVTEEELADARAALESGEPPSDAWESLLDHLGDRLVVCADARAFRAWHAALGAGARPPRVVGLVEIAALLLPGRLARDPEALLLDLLGDDAPAPALAYRPGHVRRALSELTRRFLDLSQEALHALSAGLATAWSRLFVTEPVGAAGVAQILQLLHWADVWLDETVGPLTPPRFHTDAFEADYLGLVLEDARPSWSVAGKEWDAGEPLPPSGERALPWDAEDAARLDAIFREHLPAILAEERGQATPAAYREGQHDVALEVARNFGHSGEAETQLLLVHAPTGTGKTLAYLIPSLLWAHRHGVRVGVATYTRALQEQAYDREVPRALELLKRAGAPEGAKVALLKGRENYLCWRTLKLHVPAYEASGEHWLAYCQLLAYALADPSGDLDRLPRRSPLEFGHNETYRAALGELVRQVRARTSCCRDKRDKRTCAAEVARWRAERSHLVVTNHSFVLARQEFFRHLIFDECEHLHDQAHAAWSHSIGVSQIGTWLDRLYDPQQPRQRTLFTRIAKRIVTGTPSWVTLSECRSLHEELCKAHSELSTEVIAFDTWREQRSRERDDREDHSLLREFVEGERGARLIQRRLTFYRKGSELDERLAQLAGRLEKLGTGRLGRLRRALDLARTDLTEFLDGLTAWLPLQEGKPAFSGRTFHDVEVGQRGDFELTARVLLPNEFLGRFYYPQLATAAFLSATTVLKGGFEASTAYLGLDRAVESVEDDPDRLCTLRTFRAPEAFDYSRVLVAVPRDAPSVSRDKEAFLGYVRDFVADLGERTDGRMLVLFTNSDDVRRVGARLEGHFRARNIGFWYQNMPGVTKEELSDLFRRRVDSVLLGVDTFWYGADFPGETLEHLVIVRLPYGVPDRYHHAQCAALGVAEQRRQIYMPRALAKFRQGFGRMMRRVEDRGCVYVLDHRIVDARHRGFLKELPIAPLGDETPGLARLVRGDTERCVHQALVHMGLEDGAAPLAVTPGPERTIERFEPTHERSDAPDPIDVDLEDLPF